MRRALVTMSTATCEVLRRERRATFHEGLPYIVISLKDILESTAISETSSELQPVFDRIAELGAIPARANGLLGHEEQLQMEQSRGSNSELYISTRHCSTRGSS